MKRISVPFLIASMISTLSVTLPGLRMYPKSKSKPEAKKPLVLAPSDQVLVGAGFIGTGYILEEKGSDIEKVRSPVKRAAVRAMHEIESNTLRTYLADESRAKTMLVRSLKGGNESEIFWCEDRVKELEARSRQARQVVTTGNTSESYRLGYGELQKLKDNHYGYAQAQTKMNSAARELTKAKALKACGYVAHAAGFAIISNAIYKVYSANQDAEESNSSQKKSSASEVK